MRIVFGLGFDKLRMITVEDVARAITRCAESEICNGKVYNINHFDRISKRDYIKKILNNKYGKGFNLYFPHLFMIILIYLQEIILKMIGRKPFMTRYSYKTSQKNVYFDSEKIKNELGWMPEMPLLQYFMK